MSLFVQQPAVLMTIQDGGRQGYQRFGMPESGPMDWWAFRAANLLVGNLPGAACVEAGFSSTEFYVEKYSLLAACGAGYRLFVNHRAMPLWMAFFGKPGDQIRLEKASGGNWVYLAVEGGFQSQTWMGSRSMYPAAGLGKLLTAGDQLPFSELFSERVIRAGRSIQKSLQPAYASQSRIRVIFGPHQTRFLQSSRETFLAGTYQVSTSSDRMGYRLKGPHLAHQDGADLVSQGMVLGAIQVPGDGNPIVMMPDHPTTGGYPCIATVARVDMPLLAQVEPGRGALHFCPIDVSAAQSAWVQMIQTLGTTETFQEDLCTGI